MTNNDSISRLPKEHSARTRIRRVAGIMGVAIALLMSGVAVAQAPTPDAPPVTQDGYAVHHTADLGGHIANISGSGAMYDTLINIHSGPRVLGQTFTLHALPGTKHTLLDDLTVFSNGFGGDPINFAKMDFSKGKLYEFSGNFRRDRQYFDYDLLVNPNTVPQVVPFGMVNGVPTAASLAWPKINQSPMMFNTVRRMTDTNLTILPLSKVTFRFGYSKNTFEGPSLSPGRSIGKYDGLLLEFQRNNTDDFLGAIDWKPFQHTKFTFEEQVDHYKADSFFTLAPQSFIAQEADGTPVALGNWDALTNPYGVTTASCITGSMGTGFTNATNYTIFSAPTAVGGKPIINPACDVVTSYLRSQPTRSLYPTEMLRFQSTSIKNIAMNGDLRYSVSKSTLANFYENWTGLDGVNATAAGVTPAYPAQAIRSATFTGAASAQRRVVAFDYGITWNAAKDFTFSDQIDFSNVHQPGTTNVTAGITQNTPTNPNETINYSGPLGAGSNYIITGNPNGTALYGYFGQRFFTNNATATWDASTRATMSLTYRFREHRINVLPIGGPVDQFDIQENAGIFNAALRPTNHWDINGTVEVSYQDNAFTPMTPRQLKHYRVHTMYRPKPWATLSGAFNDLERHNNTNNTGTASLDGQLQHVDYNRTISMGAVLAPSEKFAFDFNYSYNHTYISTNICYSNGAVATVPGAASTNSSGGPNLCPTLLTEWGPVKDFMDAPTQYASVALALQPVKSIHTDIGYRISAVSGSQFFNDAQEVNGSLQSAYQSPFVNIAWTVHPRWIWKVDYNYFGYGEGGPSGATSCSTSTTATSAVVPCSNFPGLTAITGSPAGFTAPRNFHANNVTLSMHYEF